MQPLTENKIILVIRETRLDDLVRRYNSPGQAKFYVEHLGADFSDTLAEHDTYKKAVATAETVLRRLGRVQRLQRAFLPNFVFGDEDLVVVLGQDGLVANTLKYLSGNPVIGVNPDPRRWDGVLLPFEVDDLDKVVDDVFKDARPSRDVTMAKAELTDGQVLHGVNDLFIGAKTHVSSRYTIESSGRSEDQSSSGIIVSTGLGSSGWLKSVMAGARAIVNTLAGEVVMDDRGSEFPWDARYLTYSVREPFPSRTTGSSIVFGKVTPSSPLTLVSQMAGNGVIFSDGIESDFLEFNSGMKATIGVAEKRGHLVV
ncbi:MAG: diacylglycerol kinase catalytic domain-containing protein [Planctomycetota bacterium]|jgi:NAD kinase